MKEDIEFQGIGKRTPYKAPEGFFETISEKTLQRAKLRAQHQRKNLSLWRTMAVAASLAAVVMLGYYMSEPEPTPKTAMIEMKKQADIQQSNLPKQEIAKISTVPVPKKAIAVKVKEEKVKEKKVSEKNDSEILVDVLADLSDEELSEMDAMYKTDPIIGQSEQ